MLGLSKQKFGLIAPHLVYFTLVASIIIVRTPSMWNKDKSLVFACALALYMSGAHLYHHYELLKK